MSKRLSIHSCWMLIFIIILLGATAGAQETTIIDIRFLGATDPGNADMVQVLLSGKNIPEVAVLEGDRPRIVIDFIGAVFPGRENFALDTRGDYVKKIRVGIHKNRKIRVVLDLLTGFGYIADQAFDHEKKIYEIRVRTDKPVRVDDKVPPDKPVPAEKNNR